MLCLAATIGWVLYRAGEDATDVLSRKALTDMLSSIGAATERHMFSAHTTLRAVAPESVISTNNTGRVVLPFTEDLSLLEDRLWVATGLFPEVTRHVYFGAEDGRFIGVNRVRQNEFELRLRKKGDQLRRVYSMAGPNEPIALLRSEKYEAKLRPWYGSAAARGKAIWSPLYTDFTTHELLLTLSKPIYRADQSLIGVVSTDMPLEQLTEFLASLSLGKKGVAFIMERSGALIATSVKEALYRMENNKLVRLKADASSSPLVREAYSAVSRQLQSGTRAAPMLHQFDDNSLGKAQAVSTVLQDSAGLDWVVVVAAPRSDFRGTVTASIYQSLVIGLIAVIVALILGFVILRRALVDIRKLTSAARSIGSGAPFGSLDIDRRDEIGQLAQSFQEMEHNLRTDRLTHVLNRDSLIAQIDFRCRNASDANPLRFALLFIDLDSFKLINDHYGHDKGDLVLMEVAGRLQAAIRKDDSVARFGGDEFVVYLHGVDQEAVVESICAKIRASLEQPILVREGVTDHIGASIGAARYPMDGQDSETLFRVADTRMFSVKKARKAAQSEESDDLTA